MLSWTQLQSHLDAGEHGPALRLLLAAWQEQPAPWLAELVDRVTALAPADPLKGKGPEARVTAWDKAFEKGDPLDVPRLLDALLPLGALWATHRLERMAALPSDPRYAARLARWASERPTGYQGRASEDFWRAAGQLLLASRDARVVPSLRELLARLGGVYSYAADGVLREILPGILEALEALPAPEAPAEARSLLARLGAGPRGAPAELGALFARVYEDPISDEPRWVLADALQEAGDPRGEFIALQLKPKLTAAERKRMRALEAEHGAAWCGGLALVVRKSNRRFERGFLQSCRLSGHPDVESVAGLPELATVEELELGDYGSPAFFEQTPMPALQTLSGKCFQVFLSSRPLPVRTVRQIEDTPIRRVTAALQACVSVPQLQELHITTSFEPPEAWQAALRSPFARPLRRLHLGGVYEDRGAWRRMVRACLPELEWFQLGGSVVTLRFAPDRVTLTWDVTSYVDGAAVASGTGARERSLEQLRDLLASDVLEPGDELTVNLVRGRFAPSTPTPVPAQEIEALRATAAARGARAEVMDKVAEGA
jgi:uncharacterized protein (TIGR02996 family)